MGHPASAAAAEVSADPPSTDTDFHVVTAYRNVLAAVAQHVAWRLSFAVLVPGSVGTGPGFQERIRQFVRLIGCNKSNTSLGRIMAKNI
jgi:hypothetical protein